MSETTPTERTAAAKKADLALGQLIRGLDAMGRELGLYDKHRDRLEAIFDDIKKYKHPARWDA